MCSWAHKPCFEEHDKFTCGRKHVDSDNTPRDCGSTSTLLSRRALTMDEYFKQAGLPYRLSGVIPHPLFLFGSHRLTVVGVYSTPHFQETSRIIYHILHQINSTSLRYISCNPLNTTTLRALSSQLSHPLLPNICLTR